MFYVSGWIPEGKDPRLVDRKLVDRYGINISKWSRSRRKSAGEARLQYIRYDRRFLLLATHGKHRFFEEERQSIRDARRTPIKAFGYAISHRGGHSHVRIEKGEYKRIQAYLMGLATRCSIERVLAVLRRLPYEPYAPVRRQVLNIVRALNRERQALGLDLVNFDEIRFRRRIVKPFGGQGATGCFSSIA